MKLKLCHRTILSFSPVAYFTNNTEKVDSLSYSDQGSFLVTSGNDDRISLYDCVNGKYGVSLIQYTHAENCVIHASSKTDDSIRYLSMHDNKYIRYFSGHTKRVTSMSMSPLDDSFLSGSADGSIRLWDLRSQNCKGILNAGGKPCAGFDPEGLIFAAGVNSNCIKLYDLRSFNSGPFVDFKFKEDWIKSEWVSIKFSPDGKFILIISKGNIIIILDAFKGNVVHTFKLATSGGENQLWNACFSSDSQYLLAGSAEGVVQIWDINSGQGVGDIMGFEAEKNQPHKAMHSIAFNPKYCQFATGTHHTSIWMPKNPQVERVE